MRARSSNVAPTHRYIVHMANGRQFVVYATSPQVAFDRLTTASAHGARVQGEGAYGYQLIADMGGVLEITLDAGL